MTDKYSAFLARAAAAETPAERDWLLLEFVLNDLPAALRTAAWVAAVPHWFDAAYLNALLDPAQGLDAAQYAAFLKLAFVSRPIDRNDRYLIHESTRYLLLEKLWQDDPARYRELSHRAAAYCQTQDQNDTAWRVETVYHLLVGKPERGAEEMNNTAIDWHNPPNFAFDKVDALARAGREHLDAGRLEMAGTHSVLYWEAVLDTDYSRTFAARDKLQQIDLQRETRQIFKANCLWELGNVHLSLSELPAARGRYEEALPLYRKIGDPLGEANCLRSLGNMHLSLSELPEARGRYEEALPLYRKIGDPLGEANCLKALGNVHLRLSELPAARGRYEEALPLYRKIGEPIGEANCLRSLGDVHLSLSELPEARGRYEEALPLYRKIGEPIGEANCLKSFGDLAVKTADYPAAQEYYQQASAQFERIGCREGVAECHEGFAELYQVQGEFNKAAETWEQAAALYEELGMPLRAAPCREKAG